MKLSFIAKSCVCASVIFVAGCMGSQAPLPDAEPSEEKITKISQLDEIPEGASTSLVADPTEGSFFSQVMGRATSSKDASAEAKLREDGPAPFGVPVKVCGVSKSKMGTRVDVAASGSSKLTLYDTNPRTKTPHDFYIVGFRDNCARKFTAAVAMFGDLQLHEIMRYELSPKTLPYSATDKAYEVLKARKCNVKQGVACGDRKMKGFARTTSLITLYEQFGARDEWASVLVHGGEIQASSVVNMR
ncbi:hypothetical protein ACFE33_11950 [Falsihalocynthiibacter sp. SS001]|uniref:hypothetical protein n=1 Tax=Falsihalocynthiibacter sp. SS001 TaxID=3349698 RepID=UPI0036D24F0F